jgi:hypothetical protein
MDSLLKMAADAGMTQEQGEAATGGIFALIKKNLESGQYTQILEKIPEIDGLVNKHEEATRDAASGGGLMGSLTSALGSSSGAGGIAGLLAVLGKQGISAKSVNAFLPQIAPLVKKQCGIDISSILGVPSSSASGTSGETAGGTSTSGEAAGGTGSSSDAASKLMGSAMGMFGKK